MRIVVQRVKEASCSVDSVVVSQIKKGFMLLVGFESDDNEKDIDLLVKKTVGLRIFSDDNGKMNLNINAISGEILAISQFTLYADCKHGNRPSFTSAMEYNKAQILFDEYCYKLMAHNINVKKGLFGADMQISLINDGPVTIILDSKELEVK